MRAGNDEVTKAPGPCVTCGHSELKHTWNNAIHGGYNRVNRCGECRALPREGDELVVRFKFCECAQYKPVTDSEMRDGNDVAEPTPVPYPANDLASQLSRALDAKTELEIRVARLEATIGRVEALHQFFECECGCGGKRCDCCRMAWPCATLRALSAERTSGE